MKSRVSYPPDLSSDVTRATWALKAHYERDERAYENLRRLFSVPETTACPASWAAKREVPPFECPPREKNLFAECKEGYQEFFPLQVGEW